MALNEVYRPDKHRSMPVPAGTKAGDPLRIGMVNGIAETDRANTSVPQFTQDGLRNPTWTYGGGNADGYASVWTWGGHKVRIVAASAPKFGDGVYFDPAGAAGKTLTATAGTLSLWGAVVDDQPTDNGDGTFTAIVDIASPTK